MAHHRRVRFFDPVALAQLNAALKWQRRYRRLRKLVFRLQGERRGHLRLIDRCEREMAFYEQQASAQRRISPRPRGPRRPWDLN